MKQFIKSIDGLIPKCWEDKCGKGDTRSESNLINNLDLLARIFMPISGDYMFFAETKELIKSLEQKYIEGCRENNIEPNLTKTKGKWIPYFFRTVIPITMKYSSLYGIYQLIK